MSENSTPTTAHETIVVSNNSTILNVNMNKVTKLTSLNFYMWNRQVHSLLDGYDLAGYVDGSTIVLPPTVTEDGVVKANPTYVLWKRKDKLIYNTLLGVISPSVQYLPSTTTTSSEIWETLSSTYVKPSRGHIRQLKQQLRQWTKGAKTIHEYFQGLTSRFDQLALLGKPEDHEDKNEYVLQGLSDDYKTVVMSHRL